LNLTSQANGITDAVAGSRFDLAGTFTAGGANGFANLNSVEGIVSLYGQSFTDTPGSGTLTIGSNGYLLANYNPSTATGTNLTISGNVSNSGVLATGYYGSGASTLTITGNLTNNGDFYLENAGDLAKVATFTNNGETYVYTGATLNLTSQANGITNAVAGSRFDLAGTFTAGGANGFANLNSVEGIVSLYGQSFTDTPGSGTLTIGSNGYLLANYNPSTATGTNLTISGNVSNSGVLATGYYGSGASTLTITGNLTNNGDFYLENAGDLAKVATFTNNGETYVYTGATLNLTSQANGITNAVAGSRFDLAGTFTAGGANGFANLNSVEGIVSLYGQSFTDTPGSGTLTIGSNGYLLANYNPSTATGTNLTISGNVSNSGVLATGYYGSGASALTITGNLTNNGDFYLENAGDLAKVATFTNNGYTDVYTGATLNLTGQPNGITDAVTGSKFDLYGTFTAGGGNGFASLTNVEGVVNFFGQNFTITPGGGTLTIASGGELTANYNSSTATVTTLTINGNVSNAGLLGVGIYSNGPNTLTITGNLTNQGTTELDDVGGDTFNVNGNMSNKDSFILNHAGDTANIGGALDNSGTTSLTAGSTLNVTGLLTNEASGLLNVTGGLVTAGGGLTNYGTVNVTSGGGIDPLVVTNGGTINIDGMSKVVVGSGGMAGQGFTVLSNGTLGEIIASANS